MMVRLTPNGYLKIAQADSFTVNYTGAEANVLVSLSRFGMDTQLVTMLPQNDIADAAIAKMRQYRVGVDRIVRGGNRMGLYYLERGASQRPSKIVYDRRYSALSKAVRADFDWDCAFAGADWLHFSGITAGISEHMADVCEDACHAAHTRGMVVSCDLNYRKAIWSSERATAVMTKLAPHVDVLVGNEEDAERCLGISPENTSVVDGKLDYSSYADLARTITEGFGIKTVAFTLRSSISASDNKWAAMLFQDGVAHYSKEYLIHLVDRVGGGDSFSAGLIYALSQKFPPQKTIEFAVAASCLKQTIEMDFNLSSVEDVLRLMDGDGSGRVQR